MSIETRITKLESRVATLPPDAGYLIAALERLPESERDAWWDSRTDAELETIATSSPNAKGLDFDRLREDELMFLANCSDETMLAGWWKQLRATKPGYFLTVTQ